MPVSFLTASNDTRDRLERLLRYAKVSRLSPGILRSLRQPSPSSNFVENRNLNVTSPIQAAAPRTSPRSNHFNLPRSARINTNQGITRFPRTRSPPLRKNNATTIRGKSTRPRAISIADAMATTPRANTRTIRPRISTDFRDAITAVLYRRASWRNDPRLHLVADRFL